MDESREITVKDEKIIIRRTKISDAKALIEYLNIIGGESDFLTFGLDQFNSTVEQEEYFIENTLEKNNALSILAEVNGKIIGNLNFSGGIRERTAHAGEFGISILKEYWGNHVGEELLKFLIEWSKNSGIIRKINLRARIDNDRGISLYKKLGFMEEGIIKRDLLIEGEFYDSLSMGMLID